MSMKNPFIIPDDGLSFTVGKPTTIEWHPDTKGKVTLWLRHANGGAQWIIAIAENIENTGEYTWTPTPDLEPGSGLDADTYTLLIGPDADDPNSVTNQALITINGSKSGSADTTSTKNTESSPSTLTTSIPATSTLSTSAKEGATVTLTVTGGAGASTLTTTGTTLPKPSTTGDSSPPEGSGGLSSAEKAGIGVGVGVGVPVILVFLGLFIWKRKRNNTRKPVAEEESERDESATLAQPSEPHHELPHDGRALHELTAQERLELSAKERLEIGEGRTRHELPGDSKPAELDGNSKGPDEKS